MARIRTALTGHFSGGSRALAGDDAAGVQSRDNAFQVAVADTFTGIERSTFKLSATDLDTVTLCYGDVPRLVLWHRQQIRLALPDD